MTHANLKDCPFCGGIADTDSSRVYRSLVTGDIGYAVEVYCTGQCGVSMCLCLSDYRGICADELLDTLVSNWNRRT